MKDAIAFIREHPIGSVAGAAVIGFLFGPRMLDGFAKIAAATVSAGKKASG